MALGPTHEEVITDLVAHTISSYRQMPITLYQIQTKFRNEERPRFGVLRTSEFLMKDAYSFDASVEDLNRSYEKMYAAYCRIFERCGLQYLAVEAESGPIGGDASHEFMVLADNGEDTVLHCKDCGYAANQEKAEIGSRDRRAAGTSPGSRWPRWPRPGAATIEQVSKFLGCKPEQMIKTLIYMADGKPIAVLVRGDHEANEGKIRRAAGAAKVDLAEPEGDRAGDRRPGGLRRAGGHEADDPALCRPRRAADRQRRDRRQPGRRAPDRREPGPRLPSVAATASPTSATPSTAIPARGAAATLACGTPSRSGHVFKLGTKYSEALGARFLDQTEQLRPIIMGCYGIGVNRIIAALIETSHDDNGIIWPVSLAPYEVLLAPVKVTDPATQEAAERLYAELAAAGVEVLLDDRDVRAGVKFKDADLIGIPLRVVIGERGLKEGKLEIKWRWEQQAEMIDADRRGRGDRRVDRRGAQGQPAVPQRSSGGRRTEGVMGRRRRAEGGRRKSPATPCPPLRA